MIFNPFELPTLSETTATAAGLLHTAIPQLQDNVPVVSLILAFLVADLMACCPKGVMRHQQQWLTEEHNGRDFEPTVIRHSWLKPVLLVQLFVCCGLTLFCRIDDAPTLHLLRPDADALGLFGLCCLMPFVWYLLQWGLFCWGCYLFDLPYHRQVLERSYHALFILLVPPFTLVLMALITGLVTDVTAVNLLAALFILSQISFIYKGFKIFYQGFGSFFMIFVYLCALEIAPLLMLWVKFGPN